jgi:hypothetical protein
MAGLPTTQLPGSDTSPESLIGQRVRAGQQRIQQEFQLEWDSFNKQAKADRISQQKYEQRSNELHTKYRRKAFEFNQKNKMVTAGLGEIDKLASSGMIANVPEAKWKAVLGPDVKSPTQQYNELDVHRNKLEQNLKNFRITPAGEIPSRLRASRSQSKWLVMSPILTAAWAMWPKEKIAAPVAEVFDPAAIGYTEKGKEKRGDWRKATPTEIKEYGLLKNRLQQVVAEQNILLQPKQKTGLMRTAVTSPRISGAIEDQARALLDQRETVTGRQEPEDLSQLSDDELRRIVEGG